MLPQPGPRIESPSGTATMKTRIFERQGTAATRSLPNCRGRRKEKGSLGRTRQPQEKRTPMWNTPPSHHDLALGRKERSSPGALRHRVLGSGYQQRNGRLNRHTTGAQEQADPDPKLLWGRSPRMRRKGNRGIGPETPLAQHSGNLRSNTTGTWSGHFLALLVDLSAPPTRSVGVRRHEVQQPPVPSRLHKVGGERIFTDAGRWSHTTSQSKSYRLCVSSQ